MEAQLSVLGNLGSWLPETETGFRKPASKDSKDTKLASVYSWRWISMSTLEENGKRYTKHKHIGNES